MHVIHFCYLKNFQDIFWYKTFQVIQIKQYFLSDIWQKGLCRICWNACIGWRLELTFPAVLQNVLLCNELTLPRGTLLRIVYFLSAYAAHDLKYIQGHMKVFLSKYIMKLNEIHTNLCNRHLNQDILQLYIYVCILHCNVLLQKKIIFNINVPYKICT